jgi:imidazolonepropionase-like amidohydrolase
MPLRVKTRSPADIAFVLGLGLLCLGAVRPGRAEELAIAGGTVHVGDGRVLQDGLVLVRDGKIAAVGRRGEVSLPDGVSVRDATGLHLTPGFVDLQSRLFVPDIERRELLTTSDLGAADALDAFDPDLDLVRAQGVTAVAVAPPSPRGSPRLGAVLKLRRPSRAPAETLRGLVLVREAFLAAALGVSTGGESTSAQRLDQYYTLRGVFTAAKAYQKQWEAYWKAVEEYNRALESPKPSDAPPPKPPARPKRPELKPGMEAALRALDGALPVLTSAHRRDDVEYARLLKDEFGLKLTVLGGTLAHFLAKDLAAAKLAVAVAPVLLEEEALEYRGHDEAGPARLHAAGVPVAIASASRDGLGSRCLRLQACAAVRGGLDREAALSAITIEPARALGLAGRLGSIEVGKDADLVLLDGDPLDAQSRVVEVIVEGVSAPSTPRSEVESTSPRARAAPERETAAPLPLSGSGPTVVLRGVRVPAAAAGGAVDLEDATVVLRGAKIAAVGGGDVAVPEGAVVHELASRWLLPGFIDAHSHLTLEGESDDVSSALTEELQVIDAFDPWDEEVPKVLGRGVTTVALAPGRLNVVGGVVSLVKLRPGRVPLAVVKDRAAIKASLAPDVSRPRYPAAYSGALDVFRSWAGGSGVRLDAPLLVHVEWFTQVEHVLDLLAGRSGPLVFIEGSLPDERVWRRLGGSAGIVLRAYGVDERPAVLRTPSRLEAAGVRFAFGTSGTRRDLLTAAVLSMQHGLSEAAVLRALTRDAAALYGVEGRIGAVAAGADADLVVWSANPFSLNARVERVFVDGEEVFAAQSMPSSGPVEHKEGAPRTLTVSAVHAAEAASAPRSSEAEPALQSAYLVRADRVYTAAGPPLGRGEVLVRGGKIAAVGRDLVNAEGAGDVRVLEVRGSVIPGLVDAGSGLGLRGPRADEYRELTSALSVIGAADLDHSDRRRALEAGVTTAALTAGTRNVIGGVAAIVKTAGASLSRAVVEPRAFISASLTPDAYSGNQSLRFGRPTSYVYRMPTTRMGSVFLLRRAFQEALGDPEAFAPWPFGFAGEFTPVLLDAERAELRGFLRSGRVRVRAETREEVLAALRLGDECGASVELEGAREAIDLAGELASRKTAVFLDAGEDWTVRDLEARPGLSARLARELARAGVPFAYTSGEGAEVARLRENAAWSLRWGLGEAEVLAAITSAPARLLGVAERAGSIEPGKDADLVALSGEPFSPAAAVLWVMVDGEVVVQDGEAVVRDGEGAVPLSTRKRSE